jgi:hypothetical protein
MNTRNSSLNFSQQRDSGDPQKERQAKAHTRCAHQEISCVDDRGAGLFFMVAKLEDYLAIPMPREMILLGK